MFKSYLVQNKEADHPPSTNRLIPVINDDCSLKRYKTALAISCGSARRLMGELCLICSSSTKPPAIASCTIVVCVNVGLIALTRMLCSAHSTARTWVRATTPALEAQ